MYAIYVLMYINVALENTNKKVRFINVIIGMNQNSR